MAAIIGGIVGGSLSAGITYLWTHNKWEKTATAFKTTARYLARLIADPESVGDLREDEKGWLHGFDQIVQISVIDGTQTGDEVDHATANGDGDQASEGKK